MVFESEVMNGTAESQSSVLQPSGVLRGKCLAASLGDYHGANKQRQEGVLPSWQSASYDTPQLPNYLKG